MLRLHGEVELNICGILSGNIIWAWIFEKGSLNTTKTINNTVFDAIFAKQCWFFDFKFTIYRPIARSFNHWLNNSLKSFEHINFIRKRNFFIWLCEMIGNPLLTHAFHSCELGNKNDGGETKNFARIVNRDCNILIK